MGSENGRMDFLGGSGRGNKQISASATVRRVPDVSSRTHLQAQEETSEVINVQWWKPVQLLNSALRRATESIIDLRSALTRSATLNSTDLTTFRDRPTSDPCKGSESNSERGVDQGQGSSLPRPESGLRR